MLLLSPAFLVFGIVDCSVSAIIKAVPGYSVMGGFCFRLTDGPRATIQLFCRTPKVRRILTTDLFHDMYSMAVNDQWLVLFGGEI